MRGQQIELSVKSRTDVGKTAARRLRGQGRIPAVVYGREMESLPVSVDAVEFARALPETAWYSTLLRLKVEDGGAAELSPTVMITEVQRDPVRNRLLSVDFHSVSMRERLHTQVPVIHVKQSPGVRQGGILEHIMHEVLVECLPSDIPEHLEADISGLGIGDALRVRDLVVPEGVKVLSPADETVIMVIPPVKMEEVAPAVEPGAVVAETQEPELVREREPKG
ncbi:MAG: 50S ribosomal protein L25 [Armatimonadota bacterium]|jgi:large subunit ribosomal protein L25